MKSAIESIGNNIAYDIGNELNTNYILNYKRIGLFTRRCIETNICDNIDAIIRTNIAGNILSNMIINNKK